MLIHSREPGPLVDVVQARHPDVEVAACDRYETLPDLLETFRPDVFYGVRFDGTDRFPAAALTSSPGLTWIAVGGAGTDHLGRWDAATVTVTNAAGVSADVMAQYVLGTTLSWSLGLAVLAEDQRQHRWADRTVSSLAGRTMLIVGTGHTGQAVARLAQAVGMTVHGVRSRIALTPFVDRVAPLSELVDLVAVADVVVVSLPLTARTRGLIGEDVLSACRPGALLVDVSRGGIVVEAALIAALRSGRLGGAVLDVFETEPLPPQSPLWDLPGVVVSPHCSSVDADWERRSIEAFCKNLDRWRQRRPLCNVVDPERGY